MAEIKEFQNKTLFPAQDERLSLILKQKLEVQNCLAIRRYILAEMYLEIKSRNPNQRTNTTSNFFKVYAELLEQYENYIAKELTIKDF